MINTVFFRFQKFSRPRAAQPTFSATPSATLSATPSATTSATLSAAPSILHLQNYS